MREQQDSDLHRRLDELGQLRLSPLRVALHPRLHLEDHLGTGSNLIGTVVPNHFSYTVTFVN